MYYRYFFCTPLLMIEVSRSIYTKGFWFFLL